MKNLIFSILISITLFGHVQAQQCIGNFNQLSSVYITDGDTLPPPITNFNDLKVLDPQNDRMVYFLHGLGGDETSWARAAQASQYGIVDPLTGLPNSDPSFPARRLKASWQIQYSQFNIAGSALEALELMKNFDRDSINQTTNGYAQNFVIAHSQGGIITRQLDRFMRADGTTPRFTAAATFGTPHQGAKAVNNKDQINQIFIDVCEAVLGEKTKTLVSNNWLLNRIFNDDVINGFRKSVCNVAVEKILPAFAGQGVNHPIQLDYAHNSPFLNLLNQYTTPIPTMAFYGEEEEPEFYRVAYHLSIKKPNDFEAFKANNDDSLVNAMSHQQERYAARIIEIDQLYVQLGSEYCNWGWWFVPFVGWIKCGLHNAHIDNERDRLKEIRPYVVQAEQALATLNDRYIQAIGAMEFVDNSYTRCECETKVSGGKFEYHNFRVNSPADCDAYEAAERLAGRRAFCQDVRVVQTWWKRLPNDGVVPAYSASNWQGGPSWRMKGSNHQQMRNDDNTKKAFLILYDSDGSIAPNFFNTKKRQ